MAKEQMKKGQKNTNETTNEDVDFLNSMGGVGTECISADDTSRNYLQIAQSNSPEVDNGDDADEKTIPGLKVGHFYSPLLKKTYGKAIEVIVLRQERVWNVWKPNRGGLVAVLPVNGCQYVKDEKGHLHDYNGNDIAETVNFYVMIVGHLDDGVLVFPVKSTGIRHAKKLNSMIAALKTPNGKAPAAIYAGVWQLETAKNTNQSGTWYTIGDNKTTLAEFSRYIDKSEWLGGVDDGFDLVKDMRGPGAAMIEGGATQGALPPADGGLDESV